MKPLDEQNVEELLATAGLSPRPLREPAAVQLFNDLEMRAAFYAGWAASQGSADKVTAYNYYAAAREWSKPVEIPPLPELTNGGAYWKCKNQGCPDRPAVAGANAPRCYTCDHRMVRVEPEYMKPQPIEALAETAKEIQKKAGYNLRQMAKSIPFSPEFHRMRPDGTVIAIDLLPGSEAHLRYVILKDLTWATDVIIETVSPGQVNVRIKAEHLDDEDRTSNLRSRHLIEAQQVVEKYRPITVIVTIYISYA